MQRDHNAMKFLQNHSLDSLRCHPSAAGFLGPCSRLRIVHCLRRVYFDKRYNGIEAATHPAHVWSNLSDSVPRTEKFTPWCLGSSFINIRTWLHYAYVGLGLWWVINECKLERGSLMYSKVSYPFQSYFKQQIA